MSRLGQALGFVLCFAIGLTVGMTLDRPQPTPTPPAESPIREATPPDCAPGGVDPDTFYRWKRACLREMENEKKRELERVYRAHLAREHLTPRSDLDIGDSRLRLAAPGPPPLGCAGPGSWAGPTLSGGLDASHNDQARELERVYRANLAREGLTPRVSHEAR